MTTSEKALWDKLNRFKFDIPGNAFNFSDRLARDNGWSKDLALAVLEEYRKFLFLCAISPTGVTPSDMVDQAWHLHLTYTHSYWTELCTDTLGKNLQHNPTKGGPQEAQKYTDYYGHTLALYQEKFGTPPPADIWPEGQQRFSDIDFVRINKRTNWVVPKPGRSSYKLYITIVLVLVCVVHFMVPADWQQFTFTTALFLVLGLVMAAAVEKSGPDTEGSGGDGYAGEGYTGIDTGNSDYFHSGHHHWHGHGGHDGHSGHSHGGDSGCSGCSASGCSGCSSGGD